MSKATILQKLLVYNKTNNNKTQKISYSTRFVWKTKLSNKQKKRFQYGAALTIQSLISGHMKSLETLNYFLISLLHQLISLLWEFSLYCNMTGGGTGWVYPNFANIMLLIFKNYSRPYFQKNIPLRKYLSINRISGIC